MTTENRPPPKCVIMFSMASRSDAHAVMTLCSVAGMLDATGSPPFSSNCRVLTEGKGREVTSMESTGEHCTPSCAVLHRGNAGRRRFPAVRLELQALKQGFG